MSSNTTRNGVARIGVWWFTVVMILIQAAVAGGGLWLRYPWYWVTLAQIVVSTGWYRFGVWWDFVRPYEHERVSS